MIRDIRIFPEARRLEMKFVGGIGMQDRLDTLALVAPLIANRTLDRILINFSAAWHEPPLDKGGVPFEETLQQTGEYAGCRVAFVSRPHPFAAPKGDGTTALGFEFQCFSGLHAAQAWLEAP